MWSMAREMELIDAVPLAETIRSLTVFVSGRPATQAEYREAVLKIIGEQPQIRVKIAPEKKKAYATKDEISVFSQIVGMYNEMCKELPKVTELTAARESAMRSRFRAIEEKSPGQIFSTFGELFEHVQKSSFLRGKNERGWRANFDWLMNPQNFAKVMGGTYDDHKPTSDRPAGSFETDEFFEAAIAAAHGGNV